MFNGVLAMLFGGGLMKFSRVNLSKWSLFIAHKQTPPVIFVIVLIIYNSGMKSIALIMILLEEKPSTHSLNKKELSTLLMLPRKKIISFVPYGGIETSRYLAFSSPF
uniref:Uncharacterized protein n=1 Tax=Cryptosporidium parvum TaxID=5807 RepID=F0X5K3_CRYPV